MSTITSTQTRHGIDTRGPRFVAWVTTTALILVLLTATVSTGAATVILAIQALVFALGAILGPRRHPYGRIYARLIAPRLGPATETEPEPPLRFAQLVGAVFAVIGSAAFVFGTPAVGALFTGFALFAALLNAAFGICLGCRLYPLIIHFRRTPASATN